MSKGLSKNQLAILKWLEEHPTAVGAVDRFQGVIDASRPSVFRALISLERRGLVKRIGIGSGHYQRWVKATKNACLTKAKIVKRDIYEADNRRPNI